MVQNLYQRRPDHKETCDVGHEHHPTAAKQALIYRMVMPEHTCPYGLKAVHLLKRAGYDVEDHRLTTREETDAFEAQHGVATTPQVFIGG